MRQIAADVNGRPLQKEVAAAVGRIMLALK